MRAELNLIVLFQPALTNIGLAHIISTLFESASYALIQSNSETNWAVDAGQFGLGVSLSSPPYEPQRTKPTEK